jgi:hypothetical protein
MKKRMIAICFLLLAVSVAHGEQAEKKEAFWEKMTQKLEKITPAKKGATTTAVGGVRGAKNDEATDIYWKGKEKPVDIAQDEMQMFTAAVDSRIKGDKEAALRQFEEFLVMYPQSAFRVEGLQAVEKIKQEIVAARGPVAKEAPVVEARQPVKAEPVPAPAPAPEAVAAPVK